MVEIPLVSASNLSTSVKKNSPTGETVFDKKYSRTSLILLSSGNSTKAYTMSVMADSAYFKSNPTKFNSIRYNSRDDTFNGVILYSTPRGKFVNGWLYQNGKIVRKFTATKNADHVAIQSIETSRLKMQGCMGLYLDSYENGELVSSELIDVYCDADSSAPPEGGGGGSGDVEPPLGTNVTNNVTDPCLKNMVNAAISSNISFNLTESMISIFNSNTDFNLNFVDNVATNLQDPTESAETTTIGNPQAKKIGDRMIITSMDLQITFNKTVLNNTSKEYVTATIMHEAIHAYLRYSQTIVNQHMDMARNYISVMADQLVKLYPNLSPSDAKNLAWGGLEKDAGSLYTDLSQVEKNNIETTNTNYKTAKSGTPCP